MKLVCYDIDYVFDTEMAGVNCLIIENQKLMYSLLMDIQGQMNGFNGRSVLSEKDKELPMAKNLELLTHFVPFDINQKSLLNKTASVLESIAVSDEYYEETMELLSKIEEYMLRLSFHMDSDLICDGTTINSLVKASGIRFKDEYDSLAEKLIDYMELVTSLDRRKLFITVNLRSFIDDDEAQRFVDTLISHQFHVVMIESNEHPLLDHEQRYIVDYNLCEIM